jgi:type I restriction enzyme, S subunit
MRSNYKRLGDYIREVNARNTAQKAERLLGVNIDKFFMPSVANVVGTDLSVYKLVNRNQFACNRMHVGRDYRLPVALSTTHEEFMVSPAYDVFEVKDTTELLPEFTRKEFDRNAWFYTDADVRGGLHWKALCDMKLPVPSISKQREIVAEYNTIQDRINLNEQLIQKLEETAQAIYKQWFVDFEFPNEEGKPYKSSGGEMVESELGLIPIGWKPGKLKDIAFYGRARTAVNTLDSGTYVSTENMIENKGGITLSNGLPSAANVTRFDAGNILISNIRPYFKKIWLCNFSGGCSNDVLCVVPEKEVPTLFLYYIIEKDSFFDYVMAGSKGTKMPRGDKSWIMKYPVTIPAYHILDQFNKYVNAIFVYTTSVRRETKLLKNMSSLLLSKLATIEDYSLSYL